MLKIQMGAYSAPSDLLADGEGQNPPPLAALWASFLRVSGSNPLQSWHLATLLMIDFKCRPV